MVGASYPALCVLYRLATLLPTLCVVCAPLQPLISVLHFLGSTVSVCMCSSAVPCSSHDSVTLTHAPLLSPTARHLVQGTRKNSQHAHSAGLAFGFSQAEVIAVNALVFFVGGLWVQDGTMEFAKMMRVIMGIMMMAVRYSKPVQYHTTNAVAHPVPPLAMVARCVS